MDFSDFVNELLSSKQAKNLKKLVKVEGHGEMGANVQAASKKAGKICFLLHISRRRPPT
jgi:creatinine amidohydrolase/Fe(II)-dependent formamide hydrolase-like protein